MHNVHFTHNGVAWFFDDEFVGFSSPKIQLDFDVYLLVVSLKIFSNYLWPVSKNWNEINSCLEKKIV